MARTKTAPSPPADGSAAPRAAEGTYTVVARRYRPQRFEDVVGQDHVVRALRNAIKLDRVAQAYLFSGTRGVGKTSMARIFAKALNCVHGPTETPCNECEICRAIASGQDVDVIEIDGASNNGVEAVRELRQNAGLRPSRARTKIYYIDEVHMLSTSAFNALLKTLEEPPDHVKFVFATTEPNKIPITVLSRCQRFDFAGIKPDAIVDQLAMICEREGVPADREALHLVARRAAGSMRDSQSLLEQLLSSGSEQLTAERVQQLLGIAGDERVLDVLEALADRDPARALTLLDQAIADGVQPTDVLNGAIEFLRDVLVEAAGAGDTVPPLAALPAQADRLRAIADRWPLDTILAAQQILAEARGRLRGSPHTRLLVELAFCRVARLEDLTDLGTLVARLSGMEAGAPAPGPGADGAAVKKKSVAPAAERSHVGPNGDGAAPTVATPSPTPPPPPADGSPSERVRGAWRELVERLDELKLPSLIGRLEPLPVERPEVVAVRVPAAYNFVADKCEAPEQRSKIESQLSTLLGRPIALELRREAPAAEPAPAAASGPSTHQEALDDPLARKLVETFEAQLRRVDAGPDRPSAGS